MLDDRSRYFEYVARKIGRARLKWRILPGIVFLLSTLTVFIEHMVVENYRWLGITQDIAQYMLKTVIFRFDHAAFRSLCAMQGCPENKVHVLLFIYYSYYAFAVVGYLASFVLFGMTRLYRRSVGRERLAFYRVMRLHTYLNDLSREPQPKVRRKATKLVRSLNLPATMSPLKSNWQKKPTLEWFGRKPLSEDTIRVLGALRAFRRKALYCLRHSHSLSRLADAVDELATFLYLANLRKETSYRSLAAKTTAEQRFSTLLKFANALNRIQIRREPKRRIVRRIADALSTFAPSRDIQVVIAIAVVAALVMVLGSAIFGIPRGTAFVAWFTVVFGSLAVSVGVTSVVSRDET